jgi:hypothetical protein
MDLNLLSSVCKKLGTYAVFAAAGAGICYWWVRPHDKAPAELKSGSERAAEIESQAKAEFEEAEARRDAALEEAKELREEEAKRLKEQLKGLDQLPGVLEELFPERFGTPTGGKEVEEE